MGNSCDGADGDHDGPRRDEESERLLRSAPKDTPKSTLKYILQHRGGTDRRAFVSLCLFMTVSLFTPPDLLHRDIAALGGRISPDFTDTFVI